VGVPCKITDGNGGTGIHAYGAAHVDFVNNTAFQDEQSADIDMRERRTSGQCRIRLHQFSKSNRDARPKLQNKFPPSRFWHLNNFIYHTFPGINYIKNDTFPWIIYEKNGLSQFAAMERPFRS
jgi:hypothetical protein